MGQFNWDNILSHPSEFVRIDEVLRQKQIELNRFTDKIPGWSLVSAQANLDHKRLIYRMRCYLNIAGGSWFGSQILSLEEYKNLKSSNNWETGDDYVTCEEENLEVLTSSTAVQFWLIMSTAFDKQNTINFFKKMTSAILGNQYTQEERVIMAEIVFKHCDFMIE
jgi:hypothetical protein